MASTSSNDSNHLANIQPATQEEQMLNHNVLTIKDALQKSISNFKNIAQTRAKAFKEVEDEKTSKYNLEKEISNLETTLKIETIEGNLVVQEIISMRKMSKDIGDIFVYCEETLKTILEGESVTSRLTEQHNKNIEALENFTSYCRDLEYQKAEMDDEFSRQREQNNNRIRDLDKEISNLKQKEEYRKKYLEEMKSSIKETTEKNELLLSQISELDIVHSDIQTKRQEKEKRQNDLLLEIQKDKDQFQLSCDETTNSLLEVKDSIMKKESVLNTLERSLKNQTDHNGELLEKIKINQNSIDILKNENSDVLKVSSDRKNEMDNVENELRNNVKAKSQDIINLEETCSKEHKFLNEIEKNTVEMNKKLEDNIYSVIKNLQLELENFQEAKAKCSKNIDTLEQQYLIISNQYQHLTDEINELNLSFSAWEKEQLEINSKKTMEFNNCNAQIDIMINKEQESKKLSVQEMNTMKVESDVKTFEMKKKLEEQLKLLKNEKENTEKEIRENHIEEQAQKAELQKISDRCNSLNEEIKNRKKLNQLFISINRPEGSKFTAPSKPASQHSVSSANTDPIIPKRLPFFDELSGSSTETKIITPGQMKEYQEQRKLRHKAREQRRAKKAAMKNKAIPPNN